MARRVDGLGNLQGKRKVGRKVLRELLDYHEGLSANQVKIVLREVGLESKLDDFNDWMYGQTCPVLVRHDDKNRHITVAGIYEYDLFRWIENQKKGTPLVWD